MYEREEFFIILKEMVAVHVDESIEDIYRNEEGKFENSLFLNDPYIVDSYLIDLDFTNV